LYQFFDPNCIYLSVQSQIRKPNSSIFDAACCDLGLKNNEVVYVGDTISRDVIGSKNARLKACIRIKSNFKDEASFKDTPYIINDLKEIFELIKKINKI
jgi:putative hydrolase of the HAD superfamily